MKKWEYKVVMDQTPGGGMEKRLNELGEEGWELVATSPVGGPLASFRNLIFKREILAKIHASVDKDFMESSIGW